MPLGVKRFDLMRRRMSSPACRIEGGVMDRNFPRDCWTAAADIAQKMTVAGIGGAARWRELRAAVTGGTDRVVGVLPAMTFSLLASRSVWKWPMYTELFTTGSSVP